ncbi:MAG: GrdX family protein [Vagococcus sp.]|uniref:GrdX family protein n=1 Tax=Vagococcus sp. TaxID=1933889 RepID=UPI002FC78DCB
MLLVTNNPKVKKEIEGVPIHYLEVEYGDIFQEVKKMIIEDKMILLTHPLSGSIKPNETYYKSIVLGKAKTDAIDIESLDYIDQGITVYEKFMKNKMRPNWTERVLEDFAFVDYYLIKDTLTRM